jgi:hypothetical protein
MNRRVVEIPVEVWEFSLEDAERIAALHRETLRLMQENVRLKSEVERLTTEGIAWIRKYHKATEGKLRK